MNSPFIISNNNEVVKLGEGLKPHHHVFIDGDIDKVYIDRRKNKTVREKTFTCMICFTQRIERVYLPARKIRNNNKK